MQLQKTGWEKTLAKLDDRVKSTPDSDVDTILNKINPNTDSTEKRNIFEGIIKKYETAVENNDKKSINEIKNSLKTYFNKELKNNHLALGNFEDIEKYFSDKKCPNKEFFPKLFLFVTAFINTDNLNQVIKSPKEVMKTLQGECDDITFLINYFATRRDIKGRIVLEINDKVNEKSNSIAHIRYYFFDIKNKEMITIDNLNYTRASFEAMNTDNWKEVIKKYLKQVICANELPATLADTGTKSEYEVIDITPSEKNCEFFREKNIEK